MLLSASGRQLPRTILRKDAASSLANWALNCSRMNSRIRVKTKATTRLSAVAIISRPLRSVSVMTLKGGDWPGIRGMSAAGAVSLEAMILRNRAQDSRVQNCRKTRMAVGVRPICFLAPLRCIYRDCGRSDPALSRSQRETGAASRCALLRLPSPIAGEKQRLHAFKPRSIDLSLLRQVCRAVRLNVRILFSLAVVHLRPVLGPDPQIVAGIGTRKTKELAAAKSKGELLSTNEAVSRHHRPIHDASPELSRPSDRCSRASRLGR